MAHVLHILFLLDNTNVTPAVPDHIILENVPGAMWQTPEEIPHDPILLVFMPLNVGRTQSLLIASVFPLTKLFSGRA